MTSYTSEIVGGSAIAVAALGVGVGVGAYIGKTMEEKSEMVVGSAIAAAAVGVAAYIVTRPKSLHVIAVLRSLPSAGEKYGRVSEDDADGEPGAKRKKGQRHSGSETVRYNSEWCERQDTVSGILELLHKERLVQVRGTPASGKTTLTHLLHARIVKERPAAQVFIQEAWPKELMKENTGRIAENLPGYPSFEHGERYFLFDEGQTTYWDAILWKLRKRRCILAQDVTPVDFGKAKVTLGRTNRGLSEPCGLLLDEKEFREVISLRQKIRLADDLRDFVYHFTQCHVGAVVAVVTFLLKKAMRALLYHESIPSDEPTGWKDVNAGTLLNLEEGYQVGFVNKDEADRYTFASPLHQQLWSWRLLPQAGYQFPFQDIFSFVKATVFKFKPSQLDPSDRRVGSASHRPPEAQYQEEYYRCIHELTGGNVRISPEYAAAFGSRAGRIDFFIPVKKWGIELTRDGSKLKEHSSRFEEDGAYGQWLQTSDMEDYILLDFRSTEPRRARPGINNLYFVVFKEGKTRVDIYDNNLNFKDGQNLTHQG